MSTPSKQRDRAVITVTPEVSGQPNEPAQSPQTLEVAGQRLTVFVESPPLYEAMLADLAAARQRIWLEVYIFSNDGAGTAIAEMLARKAREGVDVRIMYDAVGSSTTPAAFFAALQAAGAQVHAYRSFWEALRRFRPLTLLNRRNHRKLLVIDQSIGYFGGMNIVNHVGDDAGKSAGPSSGGWRDAHVRLEGAQQSEIAESFSRSWQKAHGQPLRGKRKYFRRVLRGISSKSANTGPAESIHFFDSGPGIRYGAAGRVFRRVMRLARSSVTISMAYFIPVGPLVQSLLRARRRGVRFRLIVPGSQSDVWLVQRATSHIYARLIRRGFRVYERRDQMLHAKIIIVDHQWTLVGSANMDPLSMYFNLEFLAVIRSQAFAEMVERITRFELQHSQRITEAHCRRITRWNRLLNALAWSLRWWL